MRANRSRYLLAAANSWRLRSRYAAQYSSRKRQSSSHMALRSDRLSCNLPYRMVRSMSSWKRTKALSARLSFSASNALSTREVSLPMFAICCGKVSSAHRPFSNETCCIYPMMNCSTICRIFPRTSGSRTSRDGFPCQERILMSESYSIKSSPASSTQRLKPQRFSCAEPFLRSICSRSACKSASKAKRPSLMSATHLIISPKVFWARVRSFALEMGC